MTAGIAGSLLVATRLSNYSSVADGVQVPSAMIAGMWAAFVSCTCNDIFESVCSKNNIYVAKRIPNALALDIIKSFFFHTSHVSELLIV